MPGRNCRADNLAVCLRSTGIHACVSEVAQQRAIKSRFCGTAEAAKAFFRSLLLLSLIVLGHAETAQQWTLRGRELKAKGDAAGALAAYEQAAALAPKSAELQDEIGFLLAVLQRSGESLTRFQKAIELDP